MQTVKFLVYIDKGSALYSNDWLDTLDEALATFKKGIEDGHPYGVIEFVRDLGE